MSYKWVWKAVLTACVTRESMSGLEPFFPFLSFLLLMFASKGGDRIGGHPLPTGGQFHKFFQRPHTFLSVILKKQGQWRKQNGAELQDGAHLL